tara:strand:+ start:1050 stop:2099 length:1050 start_codon:yes stop_codon:yes gene_type:complete
MAAASLSAEERGYKLTTLAEGLDFPWSIDFLPDGKVILAELAGSLKILSPSNGELIEIRGTPSVYRAGQGGLFDVLLSPDFAVSNQVFVSYAAGNEKNNQTTVARGLLKDNEITDLKIIYEANTSKYAALHYGGRLAWTSEGALLLVTGDGFDFREKAQDLNTHFGKTIRMTVDGEPAEGNPFPNAPMVFSYGHRNPQGLAISKSGIIFQHEHGPQGGDEINIIEAGTNYGWPVITYGIDYNGAYVSPFTEMTGMAQPKHVWTPSIAPSGLTIYEEDLFPNWKNSLFVGALVNRDVRRLSLENGRVSKEEILFSEIGERVRDIRTGPAGHLYIITDGSEGKIIRVDPAS